MTSGVCDFCGTVWNPLNHNWACHHSGSFIIRDDEDHILFDFGSEWLACPTCDQLILSDNKEGLAMRTALTHPERKSGDLQEIIRLTKFIHREFFREWKESHRLYERRECLLKLPSVQ
jgi:hypothetical protein